MQVVCRATVRGMTWGNVGLVLAVTWAAAMTAVVFVMAGAMREWKVRDRERGVKLEALCEAQKVAKSAHDLLYQYVKEHDQRIELVEERNTEAMPAHTHAPDPEVQRLRGEVDKVQRQLETASEAAFDQALRWDQLSTRVTALELAPPPVIPEPVDVVGVLQAALAPWTRQQQDTPAGQTSTQRTAGEDDTPTADPSLIFDPTYDEYPEPVQVTDAVGLPVIPGLPIDIPVANWGLPG